ncbi:MAG: hypothetical protein HYW63_03985 [Candidatus Levybacteria bacterium]|nr:hypothetical protein [Candidatus Levybacteria bacterium]
MLGAGTSFISPLIITGTDSAVLFLIRNILLILATILGTTVIISFILTRILKLFFK